MVMASGCVFNNYIDRDIDSKMSRTKKRATVTGEISARSVIIYGSLLAAAGAAALALLTNPLTLAAGLTGLFFYVVIYGYAKRRSVHGTLVGSISGAVPPLAGYLAATGRLDLGAVLVFLVLVAWQMPHFYSIAMFRYKDYKAAGLPVLPVKKGMKATKLQILFYIIGFIAVCALFTLSGYTGLVFLAVMAIIGLYWLVMAVKGFNAKDDTVWARKMFSVSLIVLLVLSVMLSVGGRLV